MVRFDFFLGLSGIHLIVFRLGEEDAPNKERYVHAGKLGKFMQLGNFH